MVVGLLSVCAMFESSPADLPTAVECVLASAVLILYLHFSVNEARKAKQAASSKSLVDYIFDFWNILDVLALTSIIVAFAVKSKTRRAGSPLVCDCPRIETTPTRCTSCRASRRAGR